VILNYVFNRASLIIKSSATFNAEVLSHRNLHAFDIIRFQNGSMKALANRKTTELGGVQPTGSTDKLEAQQFIRIADQRLQRSIGDDQPSVVNINLGISLPLKLGPDRGDPEGIGRLGMGLASNAKRGEREAQRQDKERCCAQISTHQALRSV
jgi:hypothetical protein